MIRGSYICLGTDYSEVLGTIVNIGVLIITFVIALSQLKIDVTILGNILLLVIGVLTIVLGLGARDLDINIISSVYLYKTVKTASTVRIGDMVEKLINIGPVISMIEVDEKQIRIDNNSLLETL